MNTKKIILGLGLVLLLMNCKKEDGDSKERYDSTEAMATTDSTSSGFISSTAAKASKDSTRKFIRTANLKFKVKDVIKSTYDIEDITAKEGGFVTYTNLSSSISDVQKKAISEAETLETTHYVVTNEIILRVPNNKLDETLKEISRNIDYLDYRVIKAEDVALQLLANKLTQKRAAKNEQRLKPYDTLNKMYSALEIELLTKQQLSDSIVLKKEEKFVDNLRKDFQLEEAAKVIIDIKDTQRRVQTAGGQVPRGQTPVKTKK